jgi:hypothetical protein
MFCAHKHVFGGAEGVAPGLVFGGSEDVMSHFLVLRSRTRFRQCGGRRVPFSSFALPDSFSAIPRTHCDGTICLIVTYLINSIYFLLIPSLHDIYRK